MKSVLKYSVIGLLSSIWSACIFVVPDPKARGNKDTLSATDSSAAHQPVDSSTLADTTHKIDSLKVVIDTVKKDSVLTFNNKVNTKDVRPQQVIDFAKTLIGVPYKYASTDPKVGFDCSGFITYVFNHFGIAVPRSSIDFTNVGKEVPIEGAKPGDLVLFTGTHPDEKFVGHMGIIVTNVNGAAEFIHSTSGKKYGVTITPLNDYYKGRYVKTIRIFPQNGL